MSAMTFVLARTRDGKACWVVRDEEGRTVAKFGTLLEAENFATRGSCPDFVEEPT